MESMGTAPIRVGTYYIQDIDNSKYNYFIACVELYDSPEGVTIDMESINTSPNEHGEDIVTVTYSYGYNNPNPITTNHVNTYHLKMFFPTMDANGNPIKPDFIEIYNTNNPGEKKVGKINTSPDNSMDGTTYPLYQPRCLVLANQPDAINSILQKFVFIIANTHPNDELRLNASTVGTDINCTTVNGTTNYGLKNASAILVPLDPTNPATAANLTAYTGIIDASNPVYFQYPELPLQGS